MNSPRHVGYCLLNLGCLAQDQGDLLQAEQLQREALEVWQQSDHEARVADASRCLGHLMVAAGVHRYHEARHYFRQALELATKHQTAPIALDVCMGVARLLAQGGDTETAVELLALTAHHEASTFEAREKARQFLSTLVQQLPPAMVQAAQDHGRARDLWAVVQQLLTALAQE